MHTSLPTCCFCCYAVALVVVFAERGVASMSTGPGGLNSYVPKASVEMLLDEAEAAMRLCLPPSAFVFTFLVSRGDVEKALQTYNRAISEDPSCEKEPCETGRLGPGERTEVQSASWLVNQQSLIACHKTAGNGGWKCAAGVVGASLGGKPDY
eukprot:747445-Hanusia_phi.AAC.2